MKKSIRKVIGFRQIDGFVDPVEEFTQWMETKDEDIKQLKGLVLDLFDEIFTHGHFMSKERAEKFARKFEMLSGDTPE